MTSTWDGRRESDVVVEAGSEGRICEVVASGMTTTTTTMMMMMIEGRDRDEAHDGLISRSNGGKGALRWR